MITIEEADFKLTQSLENSPFFDLEVLTTIKPKGKEPRQELKDAGFGMTMESCIKKIVNYRINKNNPEGAMTMKQYLQEYKQLLSEIEKLCNN